jgi:hypothetical protein
VLFVADREALGHVSLGVLRLSPVNIIPPWLSILISPGAMNKRPVGVHSSETESHPIDKNKNNNKLIGFTFKVTFLDSLQI